MMERVYPRMGDVRTVYLNAVVKESLFRGLEIGKCLPCLTKGDLEGLEA